VGKSKFVAVLALGAPLCLRGHCLATRRGRPRRSEPPRRTSQRTLLSPRRSSRVAHAGRSTRSPRSSRSRATASRSWRRARPSTARRAGSARQAFAPSGARRSRATRSPIARARRCRAEATRTARRRTGRGRSTASTGRGRPALTARARRRRTRPSLRVRSARHRRPSLGPDQQFISYGCVTSDPSSSSAMVTYVPPCRTAHAIPRLPSN
jgi:hypothetical protein